MNNKIIIGCDNAAVDFKNMMIKFITAKGFEVEDVGVSSEEDKTFYPYVAKKLALKVQKDPENLRGMLICGTGIGMAITANKFKGIRAAVGHDMYSSERSRLSNGCNVLCMGARVIGPELAKKIVEEWLGLGGAVPSSLDKVAAISEIEEENFK